MPSVDVRSRVGALSKLLADAVASLCATFVAFWIHDVQTLQASADVVVGIALAFAGLRLFLLYHRRFHERMWRYFSFRDATHLAKNASISALCGTVALVLAGSFLQVGPAVALIDGILAFGFLGGIRAAVRWRHEASRGRKPFLSRRKRVLILGADETAAGLARELLLHPESGMRLVGFLADGVQPGSRVATKPILGPLSLLEDVLDDHRIDEILIAEPPERSAEARRQIAFLETLSRPVTYRVVPSILELASGRVVAQRTREVAIEDLLRREPVRLDTERILGYLQGKTVLVTGAGGSIGSELVRQICRFSPRRVILLGHGENSIFTIERELDRRFPDVEYQGVIAALQNGDRLRNVFETFRPDVVFHAAAHKHVPLMEANPGEAIFNNIVGSRNLVELALAFDVTHFVNISTDKVVRPTSVMGASKKMVEYVVQDAAARAQPGRVFVSVRFGNVLGSRGSVIPLFKQQIRTGGPVTVTHPDMVRYFMTIPEAAQLVLQASGQGNNGEIYILDMGKPVRILDLARDLITLSGLVPDVDMKIQFTGVRPGEKLYEELMTPEERGAVTNHDKIFVSRSTPCEPEVLAVALAELREAALRSDGVVIRRVLNRVIAGSTLGTSVTNGPPYTIDVDVTGAGTESRPVPSLMPPMPEATHARRKD